MWGGDGGGGQTDMTKLMVAIFANSSKNTSIYMGGRKK